MKFKKTKKSKARDWLNVFGAWAGDISLSLSQKITALELPQSADEI